MVLVHHSIRRQVSATGQAAIPPTSSEPAETT